MTAPFLELRHATVWRGDNAALRNISLALHRGQSTAILGPNGAGKSTLLKLLSGELHTEFNPDSVCQLFGESLWSLEELRHRIGIVMPDEIERFEEDECVLDLVLSSLRGSCGLVRGMRFSLTEKSRALEAMAHIGLKDFSLRPFGELSSGEKRRVLIARALVHQPEVLVLDEPSTALDFASSATLSAALRTLIHAGRTVVWVTHHPGEIPPEISRVVLLQKGRIFADGPKKNVLKSSTLSQLFGLPLKVSWTSGWCDVRAEAISEGEMS